MAETKPAKTVPKMTELDDNLATFVDDNGMIHLVFDPEAEGDETDRGNVKVVSTQWVKIPGTEHALTSRVVVIRKAKK